MIEQQEQSLTIRTVYRDLHLSASGVKPMNFKASIENLEEWIVKPGFAAQIYLKPKEFQLHTCPPLAESSAHRHPPKAYDVGVRLDESEIRFWLYSSQGSL